MNIPDQVDHHFNAIFAGWMTAFIAVCITASTLGDIGCDLLATASGLPYLQLHWFT
jgi:hypothetical protein